MANPLLVDIRKVLDKGALLREYDTLSVEDFNEVYQEVSRVRVNILEHYPTLDESRVQYLALDYVLGQRRKSE